MIIFPKKLHQRCSTSGTKCTSARRFSWYRDCPSLMENYFRTLLKFDLSSHFTMSLTCVWKRTKYFNIFLMNSFLFFTSPPILLFDQIHWHELNLHTNKTIGIRTNIRTNILDDAFDYFLLVLFHYEYKTLNCCSSLVLTHFWPMLHLRINQVIDFY